MQLCGDIQSYWWEGHQGAGIRSFGGMYSDTVFHTLLGNVSSAGLWTFIFQLTTNHPVGSPADAANISSVVLLRNYSYKHLNILLHFSPY